MTGPAVSADLALLLDIGSAWAKASVIGRVSGRWRVVAHAEQPTAWGPGALRRSLVDRLEATGDRRLAGRWDAVLSDARRIECHTARHRGRIALVAVSRELSGNSARRAAEAAGWEVATIVTLDDGRSLAERLSILETIEVDAWLIAGGFDAGSTPRAIEAAALVAAARRAASAPVVWAGNVTMTDDVIALFEDGAATGVANPRPDPRHETPDALREHLRELLRHITGDADEANLAPVAMPRAVGALAAGSGLSILAVDLGARSAVRALTDPSGATSVRVAADGGLAGLGRSPGAAGRVARHAGDAGDDASVADLLQTLRAHPATLPQLPDELSGMQAAARLQLAALIEDLAPLSIDLVIGCGRTIAAAPTPAGAARILLDGVRPVGVTQLAVDSASLLGPLGSLPDDELREGLALLADDLLVPLGTSVVCRGAQPGQIAMRVTVSRTGWPSVPPVLMRAGQLQVVPLEAGNEAEIVIEPGPGVNLGAGRRSPRITATVTGGAVGLILDARGVPVALPRRADDRRAVLAAWGETLERGTERVA